MRRSLSLWRLAPVALLAVACATASTPVHAQDRPAPQTEQQLADQAYAQQEAGHYADAIATYLKAYEISKDALTLLNVATIYDRKLHEAALASEYYRRYLLSPDAEPERVKRVTERLTALRHEQEEAAQRAVAPAPAPAPSPAPPPPVAPAPETHTTVVEPPSSGSALRTTGIVVGSVGLAGVGAAMVLGYMAKTKNDDANSACQGSACSSQAGVQSARDAGTFATTATVTFIAGLSLVASGITLFALAPSGAPAKTTGRVLLVPTAGTTGGGFLVHGVF